MSGHGGTGPHVVLIQDLVWWHEMRQVAAIPAVIDRHSCGCWVSRNALERLEQGRLRDGDRCVRAVARHRARIETMVARRYARRGVDRDNCLRITEADFD